MKAGKQKVSCVPVAPENLDKFVMDMIEALKEAEDAYAVAEVDRLLITPALTELMLFVGITCKQSGTRALFAWTEAINSTGGSLNDPKEAE